MDFSLSEEQSLFRDSVRRFVVERYPFDRRRAVVAEEPGFLEEHWHAFAELGWLALPLPEEHGGLGGTPVETMVLMEELGRGLVASPYLATVVLGATAVQLGGSAALRADVLPGVADGAVRLTVAAGEPQSRYDLEDVATRAARDGDGFRLDGEKSMVPYAAAAHHVVVPARTAGRRTDRDGVTLFLVDAGAPGVGWSHHRTHDDGRASGLRLEAVRVPAERVLGPVDGGLGLLERVADHGIAALCAEACGAMWSVYERTLEYAKTREQFGRAIGSFQAVQHRLVDAYMRCELARSMVIEATFGLGEDDATRARKVSAAKCQVDAHARHVGEEGVQLHGGIGMTMDYPVGHFLKRITAIGATLGDESWHLRRYRALGRGTE